MLDSNEIGGFILNCRQVGYLRQLRSTIEARLADLGEASDVCRVCSGRRVVMKNLGEGMTEVPCPACSKPAVVEDPRIIAGFQEQLSALQEALIKRDATIDGLQRAMADATKPPEPEKTEPVPEQVQEQIQEQAATP